MSTIISPKIDSSFVNVGDQRLHIAIKKGAQSDALPLLIINGIGANVELLYPLIEQFHDDQTVITFDIPGIGGSAMPSFPYRFPNLATMISKLLQQLGYQEVAVMGISWGGALAQEFARKHPEHCVKLILVATSAGSVMIPGKPSVLLRMATPLRYLSPKYMLRAAPYIYGGILRRKPELLLHHTRNIKMRGAMGYLFQLLAGAGWTSIHWLHRLKQPTMVLAGDDDPIVPLINAKILARRIPYAELHIFNGGHLFVMTDSEDVVALVERFLAKP